MHGNINGFRFGVVILSETLLKGADRSQIKRGDNCDMIYDAFGFLNHR